VFPQLSRYLLVSLVAVAADFGFFVMLSAASVRASLAGILGYGMGMLVHYLLSSRFVFDAIGSGKSETRQLIEFALSGLAGVTLTGLVIAFATAAWGLTPVAAKSIAVPVSFAAVFLIRRCFVFAPAKGAKLHHSFTQNQALPANVEASNRRSCPIYRRSDQSDPKVVARLNLRALRHGGTVA
jgi:putative flippase GtrA